MWPIFLGLFRTFLGEVLRHLHFASDNLKGPIPLSFGKSSIQTLWLTSQTGDSRLNGTLTVLQNMSSLTQLWLEGNHFTGHLPDLSTLTRLEDLTLTGIVSSSSVYLSKLIFISFADDIFQGSARRIDGLSAGVCMQRVEEETILAGTISSDFSMLTSIEQLILSNNTLSGTLPNELTSLPNLKILDVSNNHLSGRVPYFMQNMIVNTDGNPDIRKDVSSPSPGASPGNSRIQNPSTGKLFNGTKIAIKRMEVQILSERRLKQFETEIAVLTKFATHSDPENIIYLVKWFRTMLIKQEKLQMAVDETIEFTKKL
ncbi:hypothetical protein WN944_011400 [Citrus x changshan-huyou]|uniref:Uncharacterized protein n=1 Tax=Citrus x changshan-huyou TaxID=2935761 RepID=A0AAP0R1G3_9ROSI